MFIEYVIGDRVRVVVTDYYIRGSDVYDENDVDCDLYPNMLGEIGTVIEVDTNDEGRPFYGVHFDNDIEGHSCGGRCPDPYGWYVRQAYLQPLDGIKRGKTRKGFGKWISNLDTQTQTS